MGPLLRLEVSPVPHRSWGRPVDVLWLHNGRLSCTQGAAVGPSKGPRLATVDDIIFSTPTTKLFADIISPTSSTKVFADRAALDAAAKLLSDSGNTQAARAIPYLVNQGYCSPYVCLTTALSTRWWDPFDGKGTLNQWRSAFHVRAARDDHVARALYDFVSDDDPAPPIIESLARKLATAALQPSSYNQFWAYDLSRSLAEQWGALVRKSPSLVERFLLTGEVVRCKPLRFGGGLILVGLSRPCRLRTGQILVFQDRSQSQGHWIEATVDLQRFRAHDDDGNDGLFAEINVGKWSDKSSRLLLSWQAGEQWLLTAAPVTPKVQPQRAMWLTNRQWSPDTPPRKREAPIDVILAGS